MKRSRIESSVIYLLVGVLLITLVYMYMRLDGSVKSTAEQLLNDKSLLVENKLDNFFDPIHQKLHEEWLHGQSGVFDSFGTREFAEHFFATVSSNRSIYATYVSDQNGDHQFIRKIRSDEFGGRDLWISSETFTEIGTIINQENALWKYEKDTIIKDTSWNPSPFFDPRQRPWFQSAIKSDSSICTIPYWFSGKETLGITLSRMFVSPKMVRSTISLDITLKSLSNLTSNLSVAESGKAFIITDSAYFLGLPAFQGSENDSLEKYAFTKITDFKQSEVKTAYTQWLAQNQSTDAYQFDEGSITYWSKFTPYRIGEATFYFGVVAPENEIAGSIQQTKRLLLFGMIFIVVFALFLVQAYRSKGKANNLLELQKTEIQAQKNIVEEKNNEIIDSINYARRIQKAILPPDKEFYQTLPNSFVYYQPKDIVAGDFYWMIKKDDKVLVAAADCTGHGVPGALVSVICNNGLNRSVNEFGLLQPSKILDKTRELVIREFEKSEEEVKDGMDIALLSIDKKSGSVAYSGAHNPLWMVRKGENSVEEIKASKQPIGKFAAQSEFENHNFKVSEGDLLYIFSDGYADQFGGPKGKKFKSANFKKLLLSIKDQEIEDQKKAIVKAFKDWKGEYEQLDDICVIGIRI